MVHQKEGGKGRKIGMKGKIGEGNLLIMVSCLATSKHEGFSVAVRDLLVTIMMSLMVR